MLDLIGWIMRVESTLGFFVLKNWKHTLHKSFNEWRVLQIEKMLNLLGKEFGCREVDTISPRGHLRRIAKT